MFETVPKGPREKQSECAKRLRLVDISWLRFVRHGNCSGGRGNSVYNPLSNVPPIHEQTFYASIFLSECQRYQADKDDLNDSGKDWHLTYLQYAFYGGPIGKDEFCRETPLVHLGNRLFATLVPNHHGAHCWQGLQTTCTEALAGGRCPKPVARGCIPRMDVEKLCAWAEILSSFR